MMNNTFNEEEEIFYVDGESLINYAEIKEFLQNIVDEHPDIRDLFVILDYTKSEFNFDNGFITYTLNELTELVDQLRFHFNEIYAAHIVKDNTKSDVLIKMFSKQKFKNRLFHIEIFNNRQSGKEWLIDIRNQHC